MVSIDIIIPSTSTRNKNHTEDKRINIWAFNLFLNSTGMSYTDNGNAISCARSGARTNALKQRAPADIDWFYVKWYGGVCFWSHVIARQLLHFAVVQKHSMHSEDLIQRFFFCNSMFFYYCVLIVLEYHIEDNRFEMKPIFRRIRLEFVRIPKWKGFEFDLNESFSNLSPGIFTKIHCVSLWFLTFQN